MWWSLWVLAGCGNDVSDPQVARVRREPLRLAFPIAERERIADQIMGMDHDPDQYEGARSAICTNFEGEGFPFCYDSHDGSDFDLIGGFAAMDEGSATIIAAASGIVVRVVDEHYDRCHLDLSTLGVDCDGHEMKSNAVVIEHANGYKTAYKHLMQFSAMVQVGEEVEQGTPLGLIGSSGYSTAPHLHLELRMPDGTDVDPFAGSYSQPESWWCEQRAADGLPGPCPAQ